MRLLVDTNVILRFADPDDVPGIATGWLRLVVALNVQGIQVHDANHAAAAIVHGATHVLTLNPKDSGRFRPNGLEALTPTSI